MQKNYTQGRIMGPVIFRAEEELHIGQIEQWALSLMQKTQTRSGRERSLTPVL